jgi:undecaprenyl-diphosphatase
MNIDTNIFFFFNNFAGINKTGDHIIVFFAEYLAFVIVAFFLIYLFYAAYSKKEKYVILCTAFLASLIARYAIGSTIRFLWHRPRPFVVLHVHQLIPESSYSFPSGHASFFFAFSSLVYFYNKKLGVTFFIATLFMTMGRIAAGVHYPSDIIGGMIVGILSAWFTYTYITPLLEKAFNVELKIKKG